MNHIITLWNFHVRHNVLWTLSSIQNRISLYVLGSFFAIVYIRHIFCSLYPPVTIICHKPVSKTGQTGTTFAWFALSQMAVKAGSVDTYHLGTYIALASALFLSKNLEMPLQGVGLVQHWYGPVEDDCRHVSKSEVYERGYAFRSLCQTKRFGKVQV